MLIIDTATLLYTSFPPYMLEWTKIVASVVGSVTIEGFLLMISVNMYLLEKSYGKKTIPFIFGIFSTIMTLFFFETFNEYDLVITSKKIFVSLIFGSINYLLSEVFVEKWKEYSDTLKADFENTKTQLRLVEIELEYEALKQDNQRMLTEIQGHKNSTQYIMNTLESVTDSRDSLMVEVDSLKAIIAEKERNLSRKGINRKAA